MIQLDQFGQIVWMNFRGETYVFLVVGVCRQGMGVSLRGTDIVAMSSRDEAQADYLRAMAAYNSGDRSAARETFLRLAETGHAPSQYAVGDMFYQGDGVEKDLEEAARWIGRAAASRMPGALYHLGLLQLRGEGVAQDPVEAYVSMRLAADLGNLEAAKVVEQLGQRLDPAQLAGAKERIEIQGIRIPILIHWVEPRYPELARVAKLDGSIVLQAIIRRDGSVVPVEVLANSQPNVRGFEDHAIEAVSQWRYEPARRRDTGEPVEVYFTIVVEFEAE